MEQMKKPHLSVLRDLISVLKGLELEAGRLPKMLKGKHNPMKFPTLSVNGNPQDGLLKGHN